MYDWEDWKASFFPNVIEKPKTTSSICTVEITVSKREIVQPESFCETQCSTTVRS